MLFQYVKMPFGLMTVLSALAHMIAYAGFGKTFLNYWHSLLHKHTLLLKMYRGKLVPTKSRLAHQPHSLLIHIPTSAHSQPLHSHSLTDDTSADNIQTDWLNHHARGYGKGLVPQPCHLQSTSSSTQNHSIHAAYIWTSPS